MPWGNMNQGQEKGHEAEERWHLCCLTTQKWTWETHLPSRTLIAQLEGKTAVQMLSVRRSQGNGGRELCGSSKRHLMGNPWLLEVAAQTSQKAQVCLVNSMEFPEASSETNTFVIKKRRLKLGSAWGVRTPFMKFS